MYKNLVKIISASFLIVLVLTLAVNVSSVRSAASHIVISEVQVTGSPSNDEFIELYNPTDSPVDISGWSIQRSTTGGSFSRKNFEESDSVPAHGYFLVAHNDYNGSVTADMSHSSFTLSSTGTTVFLVNDQVTLATGNEASVVDKVAIGASAVSPEGAVYEFVPGTDESVERKACSSSDSASMSNGDSANGNGEDTDNNSSDFVNRTSPDPKNSSSAAETPGCAGAVTPTPTLEPTPTVEPTATPTEEPTPTDEPTVTPTIEPTATPTEEPSVTPTVEPTPTTEPTPTEEPAVTPTVEPTPTQEPTPTTEPTPTATPEPEGRVIGLFPISNTVCRLTYRVYNFGFLRFFFPRIVCS